jgi:hypothetical protein
MDMYDFDLRMQLLQFKVDKMNRGRLNLMQSLESIKTSSKKENSYMFDYPSRTFDNTDNRMKCLSERLFSRRLISPSKVEVGKKIDAKPEVTVPAEPSNSLPKYFKLDNIFTEEEYNTTNNYHSEIKRHIKNVSSR